MGWSRRGNLHEGRVSGALVGFGGVRSGTEGRPVREDGVQVAIVQRQVESRGSEQPCVRKPSASSSRKGFCTLLPLRVRSLGALGGGPHSQRVLGSPSIPVLRFIASLSIDWAVWSLFTLFTSNERVYLPQKSQTGLSLHFNGSNWCGASVSLNPP